MHRCHPRTGGAIALTAIIALSAAWALPAAAQTTQTADATSMTKAERKAALQRQLEQVQSALAALDAEDAAPPAAPPAGPPATSRTAATHEVVVTAERAAVPVRDQPTGQTIGTVSRDQFKNSPAFSVADILALTPGVTMQQGNGPRDVSISVRGSNGRQTYGVRNIQMFEDGFPVTQPDGLGRSDLTDPHAYAGIDVIQGPASALYGNYATGGAVNFRTRTGADIDRAETGVDVGSFGYVNAYATAGAHYDDFDYSFFGSHVRGNGSTAHSSFNTTTENLLATFQASPRDRVTVKLVNNDLDTNLSLRLSLNQFNLNPYQAGCATLAAAGCGSVSVYANGTKLALSPDQTGLGRHDRRTIAGARWEHDVDNDTVLRTQFVFDNRDYNQPTSATSARGTVPSFNLMSDVTNRGQVFGLEATQFAGLSFNYEDINSYSYNLAPATAAGGGATLGALTQTIFGHHYNVGARLREELALAPQWKAVVGVGGDYTDIDALQTAYGYPTSGGTTTTLIRAQRSFVNVAPEASLVYTPDPDWQLHARVATGYGTPQAGNLFVTQAGTYGNNTQLKAQSNVGIDLGADWTLGRSLKATVTGFYEFFSNELVSQSAGANLQTFTFNAPSSVHRGIEVSADWQPLPDSLPGAKLSTAYLLDDQYYDDYVEVLSGSGRTVAFNRSGNKIPGVMPSYLNARVAYDQPTGALKGLGGFVEVNHAEAFMLDNANLLKAPGYDLVNVNLHYEPSAPALAGLRLYVEVRNVFNETYVASASNITDTLNAAGGQNGASTLAASTGSIWAGSPRTVIGGVRMKF
ncbi:TonB-dependent receptor [Nitrospirillum amazonense]|uniref:TonB-dependent receptor family protein n=1 Tax=Nitrospirillum amazonense TaxID=28077 RepID=UPI002DD433FE|nr:TonB-dependent receptor [Nitrospirillum amazonense]MEC4589687.1 TonB-dependent receptor [Nitrospirillum amazonense]